MNPLIAKTFGGLSTQYYIRQFFFGLIFFLVTLFILHHATLFGYVSLGTYIMLILNTLLFPYARFVYESVVGYFTHNKTFFANAAVAWIIKLITMVLCWMFAIFISPIGLLYFFVRGTKS